MKVIESRQKLLITLPPQRCSYIYVCLHVYMYVLHVTVITCACQCDSIKKLDDDDDESDRSKNVQNVKLPPTSLSDGMTATAVMASPLQSFREATSMQHWQTALWPATE